MKLASCEHLASELGHLPWMFSEKTTDLTSRRGGLGWSGGQSRVGGRWRGAFTAVSGDEPRMYWPQENLSGLGFSWMRTALRIWRRLYHPGKEKCVISGPRTPPLLRDSGQMMLS